MKKSGPINHFLHHIDDNILVVGLDGKVISANNWAIELLGFTKEEVIGAEVTDLLCQKSQNQSLCQLVNESLKSGLEHHAKKILITTLGSERKQVQITTSFINDLDPSGKLGHRSLGVFIKVLQVDPPAPFEHEEYLQLLQEKQALINQLDELKKSQMRMALLRFRVPLLIFFAFAVVLFYVRSSLNVFPYPQPAKLGGIQRAEQLAIAKLDTFSVQLRLAGTLQPYSKVTLAAQTSGTVVRRNFESNGYVEKDQILYQMDTRELAKNVRSARVAYIELLERYNELKRWDSSLVVMQAKRKFELAKIALNDEKRKLGETEKLFNKGIIPRLEYEQARTNYKKAEYEFENSKQQLDAEQEKGSADRVEVLRLRLSNAKEELDEIEAQYEATLIRAPVSGIIMLPELPDGRQGVLKNEGEMLKDGDLVATIGATDAYIIEANVGEATVKNLRVGQRVEIIGPSLKGVQLQGFVERVAKSPSSDGAIHYYPVHISITEVPDAVRREIRIGTFVEVVIPVEELSDVVTVPIEAVSSSRGKDQVFVMGADGNYEKRIVKVSHSDGRRIIVDEGITAGETILIGLTSEL